MERGQKGGLWLRLGLRLALFLVGGALVWGLGRTLLELLGPFLLAVGAAWLLNRPILWVQGRLGGSRGALSLLFLLLACALAGGAVFGMGYVAVDQLRGLLGGWEESWGRAHGAVAALEEWLEALGGREAAGLLEELAGRVGEAAPAAMGRLAEWAGGLAVELSGFVGKLVIFLLAAYFISADYPRLRAGLLGILPPALRRSCARLKGAVVEGLWGYLRAELLLSLGVLVILLGGFAVTREPYGVLLALALAVLDLVPIVGSGTVMVPWAGVELLLGNYAHALGLGVIWGLVAVFRRVAEPKLVGRQAGLSPVLSLLSLYVGLKLGGVWGMVLGPVAALVGTRLLRAGVLAGTLADLRAAGRELGRMLRREKNAP